MTDTVHEGVPAGAAPIIPRLVCRNAGAEVDFVTRVFGAAIGVQRPGPDGGTAHAMLLINSAMLMIEAEWPSTPSRAPATDGSSPVVLYIYVKDVDETVTRAIDNGATLLAPVNTQFWGDRTGWILDPAGHVWTVASRVEETTEQQRQDRWTRQMNDERHERNRP